jgi:hypothetical protein
MTSLMRGLSSSKSVKSSEASFTPITTSFNHLILPEEIQTPSQKPETNPFFDEEKL